MTVLRLVPDERDEVTLFTRWASARDEAAVAELWRRHQRLAIHLVARLLRRHPDAPELARGLCDEAFVHALQTFQPSRAAPVTQPFRTWFLTIARRRALDVARRPLPTKIGLEPLAVAPDQARRLLDGEQVAQARSWVLSHFLPSDWAAVEQYADGWSWAEIAAANPVAIDLVVPFASGSAVLEDPSVVGPVLRVLVLSPKLSLRIVGTEPDERVPGLALARARAVREALITDHPATRRRIRIGGTEADADQVHFEITDGATRTADAQRVRVQTILERYRTLVGAA